MLEIDTILTPIDFSENAQKIAESAAELAGLLKAGLLLVFVAQNFEDYSGFLVPPMNLHNLEDEIYRSAQERMNAFMEDNKKIFSNVGVENVEGKVLRGDVAEEILNCAGEIKKGLIVMGTHGYRGIERVMFGSVADKVVKNACCPVLTINPYRKQCEGMKKED